MTKSKITHEEAMSEITNCKSKFCIGLDDDNNTFYYDISVDDLKQLSFALSLVFKQRPQYIEPVIKAIFDATKDENYLRAFLLNKYLTKQKESE